jgi:hypothetical protein
MKFTGVVLLGCVLACLLISAVAKDKDVKELQIGVKVSSWRWAQGVGSSQQQCTNRHNCHMTCPLRLLSLLLQHKPKECTRKAKPGDTVHVHYTVGEQ